MLNTAEFSELEHQKQSIDKTHLDNILKSFRKDGYVLLKDVLSKEYIHTLYLSFMSQYGRYFIDKNHEDALKVGNKRFQISVEVKDVFNSPQLYANPFVLSILEAIFNYDFIISDLDCVTSLPGAKKMHIHRDGVIFDWHPIVNLLPPHAIGVLIPLIPFNQHNGTTRVWPGSQRTNLSNDELLNASSIDLEVDTGSCILLDYRVFHSGNPNFSEQVRPLLCISYSAPWYYDPANFEKQAPLIVDDINFNEIPENYRKLFKRRLIKPTGNTIFQKE